MVTLKEKIRFLSVPMLCLSIIIFSIASMYEVWYYALCYAFGITVLFSIMVINIPDPIKNTDDNDDDYMEMP